MQGYEILKDSADYPLVFPMVDAADHITGKTGLSPTVTISKNGGAFGPPNGVVSPIGNGIYKVAGNATDSNTLGPIVLHAEAAGADPIDMLYPVIPGVSVADVDSVMIEENVNMRQAIRAIGAFAAGKGGPKTGGYRGMGVADIRIAYAATAGERTDVTLNLED